MSGASALPYSKAAFPRIVISSEREKSFSFAVKKKREESGKRETPYCMRLGITVLHAGSFTKENGNGKRKRSLGCARDDETRKCLCPFLFILRQPTSAPSEHLLPREGGRTENAAFPASSFQREAIRECRFPPIVISSECEKSFSLAVRQRM